MRSHVEHIRCGVWLNICMSPTNDPAYLIAHINDMTPLPRGNVRTTAGVVTLIVTGYIYIIISCPEWNARKKSTAKKRITIRMVNVLCVPTRNMQTSNFETKKIFTIYVLNTWCGAVVKKIPGCWARCKHLIMANKKIGGTNSRTCAIWLWAVTTITVTHESTLPEEENYIYKYTHLLHVLWEC